MITIIILTICIGLLIYSSKSIYKSFIEGRSPWCFFNKCDKCNNHCCACYYSDMHKKGNK